MSLFQIYCFSLLAFVSCQICNEEIRDPGSSLLELCPLGRYDYASCAQQAVQMRMDVVRSVIFS